MILLFVSVCSALIQGIHSTRFYYKPGNVTIGALLPIHGASQDGVCSKLRPYGLGFAETLIYSVELINNNSEILRGITLGYDIRDYCGSPTMGMNMTHEFVKQNFMLDFAMGACGNLSAHSKYTTGNSRYTHAQTKISAVIGAHDSGTTVLVAELLSVVNIPIISPFSTSEQLSSYREFFRTIPPDGLQARAMADLISTFNWSYVGVVAVDHSYGRYGVKYLEEVAMKRAFCTGTVEYLPRLGYKSKMESIIYNLIKQKLVRVIVLWANADQTIEFLKTAMTMGLRDRVWILSDDVMALSSRFFDRIGDEMNGVILGIAHRHYSNQKHVIQNNLLKKLKRPHKGNKLWDELFQLEFGCTLSNSKTKLPTCNPKSMNFSRALNDLYNSYSPYLVDAVQAVGKALHAMYNCNNSLKKCPKTSPFINSEDLLEYLKNVSFQGATGKIGFNSQGNPISSSYDILHIHPNSKGTFVKTQIGTWSLDGLEIKKDMIKWTVPEKKPPSSSCMSKCAPGTLQTTSKNCCWECIPCKDGTVSLEYGASSCIKCPGLTVASSNKNECLEEVIVNVTIASDIGIIITVIAGIGILCSLISLSLFIKYHTTPLVKASNRELSFLLLLIITAGFIMAILHMSFPTANICIFHNVWRYTIHCLCISILYIKTIRLAGAFQLEVSGIPKILKRFVINSKLQFLTLILLNTCPVIFALLWSLLDNPYVDEEKREVPHRIEREFSCKPYRGKTGMGLQITSLCYLLIITLACIYHSFKARNLPGNFNETRYIGSSLYILLISWLVYYPISSFLLGWYATVISNATALLSWYGLLLCIFGPKIYIILIHPHMNTNEFVRAELRTANRGVNSVTAQSQCTDKT